MLLCLYPISATTTENGTVFASTRVRGLLSVKFGRARARARNFYFPRKRQTISFLLQIFSVVVWCRSASNVGALRMFFFFFLFSYVKCFIRHYDDGLAPIRKPINNRFTEDIVFGCVRARVCVHSCFVLNRRQSKVSSIRRQQYFIKRNRKPVTFV